MRNQSKLISLPFFDELRLRLRNPGISIQEIIAFIRIKDSEFITEKNIKNITNQLEVLRITLIKEFGENEEDLVTDVDDIEDLGEKENSDKKFIPKLDEMRAIEALYFFQKTRVDEMRKIEKEQQFPMKMVQWGVDSLLKILNSSFEMKLESGMIKKDDDDDDDYTKINISIEAKKYGDRVVSVLNQPESRNRLMGIAQKLAIAASSESLIERTKVDKTEVLVDKKKGSKK